VNPVNELKRGRKGAVGEKENLEVLGVKEGWVCFGLANEPPNEPVWSSCVNNSGALPGTFTGTHHEIP